MTATEVFKSLGKMIFSPLFLLWSLILKYKGWSPLFLSLIILFITAIIEGVMTGNINTIVSGTLGRLFTIDGKIGELLPILYNGFNFWIFLQCISLITLILYIPYLIYRTLIFFLADHAPLSNIILVTIVVFFLFLYAGNSFYGNNFKLNPIENSFNFIKYCFNFTKPIQNYMINDSIFNISNNYTNGNISINRT